MPQAFDRCKERPAHIDEILNGLNRYNPETTTTFQDYVSLQCEEKFFDVYASLALLKLYVYPSCMDPLMMNNFFNHVSYYLTYPTGSMESPNY
jgi:translation initiation factor 3 subunit K